MARIRIVVVLPAPLGPMKPNTSPRLSFRSIDLMANSSPYFFVRSRVSIIKWEDEGRNHREFVASLVSKVTSPPSD